MHRLRVNTLSPIATCLLTIAAVAAPSRGQSSHPAIFVANNGNAEGSVTSFLVNPDGTLAFVQKVVTPGSTNAQCIDISPNGRWLCTGHGTANGITEQLTFFEVHSDATMSIVLETTTPDSPVDVVWLDDDYIVVTNTSANPDQLIVYHFIPSPPSISQVWFSTLGTSMFDVAIDRPHNLLYPRSSSSAVWPMRINPNHTLTKLTPTEVGTGVFYFGPGLSPDGSRLYFGGGISGGGHAIGGFSINTTSGALTALPGSPFTSAGNSPKQIVVSNDGRFAFASHGTSGDVYGFSIDGASGALSPVVGSYFDVGTQGQCSKMAVLNNRFYVLRYYSNPAPGDGVLAFQINRNGTLTQIGAPLYPTQGSLPWDIAVWPGVTCAADIDHSGGVNVNDLLAVIIAWGPCADPPNCPADVNHSGTVNVDDLLAVITAWGPCP